MTESAIMMLIAKGWIVAKGEQDAFPNLYTWHEKYGHRWIETLGRTISEKFKAPFWRLNDATEASYLKLFSPPEDTNG